MDPILYWNEVVNEADRTTHTTLAPEEAGSRGPCGSSRAYAIVHLAMHDAYFGINGKYAPYLAGLPTPDSGANADSAVAAAAHATLSALYPAQKAFFDAQHAAAGLPGGQSGSDGHEFGLAVAATILAFRKDDPGLSDNGYASSVARMRHRKDPDNPTQPFYAPFYGARSRNFAVTERHHLDESPQLGSDEYTRALRQVRSKGIAPQLIGTLPADLLPSRTPTETVIGVFWGYDGAKELGTPPRLYNQIVRKIADRQANDVAANARLFAVVNAALGDAGILAWDDKYVYDVWRPVVGIREHDPSTGPAGVGGNVLDVDADPGWLPLGAQNTNNVCQKIGQKNSTPPFPAYPSGHATFGAAVFQSVRCFYGKGEYSPDDVVGDLEFVSDELNGISVDNTGTVRPRHARNFPGGLWQMIEENGRSRVFLGVHWVFDAFAVNENNEIDLTQNIGGVRLGLDIANDIATNGLTAAAAAGPRLPEPSDLNHQICGCRPGGSLRPAAAFIACPFVGRGRLHGHDHHTTDTTREWPPRWRRREDSGADSAGSPSSLAGASQHHSVASQHGGGDFRIRRPEVLPHVSPAETSFWPPSNRSPWVSFRAA